jgi:N-acetylmuramoyl-L-alanine amidase
LGAYLEKAGYTVVYTRTKDALLYKDEENIKGMRKIFDLKNRLKIAESYPEAIFISIHMNSFGEEKYSGLQVYYSENHEMSKRLAQSVQNRVKEVLQPENKRTIKPGDNIYLMERCQSPAILIECGFISNEKECNLLSEKEYQKELSFAIMCGIINVNR